MVLIFAQDTKVVTIRIDGKLSHLVNHCLLSEKDTILPQNNHLFDTVGRLMASYNNQGIGQYGIEGNAFWNCDRHFTEWDGSLIAALYYAPMQYLRVSEALYYEKLRELPPLSLRCTVYNPLHSCYQIPITYITGEGNFVGGYANSQGYWLLGIPEDTSVLPTPVKPRSGYKNGWKKAKTILEIYQD